MTAAARLRAGPRGGDWHRNQRSESAEGSGGGRRGWPYCCAPPQPPPVQAPCGAPRAQFRSAAVRPAGPRGLRGAPYVRVSVRPCVRVPVSVRSPRAAPPPPSRPHPWSCATAAKVQGRRWGPHRGVLSVSARIAALCPEPLCSALYLPSPPHPHAQSEGPKGKKSGGPGGGGRGPCPCAAILPVPDPKSPWTRGSFDPFPLPSGNNQEMPPPPHTSHISWSIPPSCGSCGGSVGLGARGSSPGPPHLPPVLLGPLRLCPVSGVTPGLLLPHSCARGSVLTLHMDPVPCRWFHLVLLLRVPFGQQLSWRGVGMRQPLSCSPGAQLSSVASVALLSCSPTAQALLVHPAHVPPPCLSFPHVGQSCAPAAHWLRAVQSSSSCGVPM